MRLYIGLFFGLFVLAALAQDSVASTASPGADVRPPELNEPGAPAPAPSPAALASATTGYVIDDKHKLIAGDKVSFQILEDRMLKGPKGESRSEPKNLVVTDSTELDIPYIGRVSAAHKTCKQLAAEVKALLENDFYYRATVIIGLNEASKTIGKVYVIGPVRKPGPIDIPANETFTAGKAIMRAEGFGDFADKKNVKVIRKGPNGNLSFLLNMAEILEKGKTEADITLQPEDLIIVPQRAINF